MLLLQRAISFLIIDEMVNGSKERKLTRKQANEVSYTADNELGTLKSVEQYLVATAISALVTAVCSATS